MRRTMIELKAELSTATFPVRTEEHGSLECKDCEREIPLGGPYSLRFTGRLREEDSAWLHDTVCVYCALPEELWPS